MTALAWSFARLGGLSAIDVHDALRLRAEVFVLEQNCVFQDPDLADQDSWHLLGRDQDGSLIAYLRIIDPGVKYVEPSIGRVVTSPKVRRLKFGRELMAEGIMRCAALWPKAGIAIGAQQRLERFYQDFAFVQRGDPYLEDGIWHIAMIRPAGALLDHPTQS